jgi:hypothetical protein
MQMKIKSFYNWLDLGVSPLEMIIFGSPIKLPLKINFFYGWLEGKES